MPSKRETLDEIAQRYETLKRDTSQDANLAPVKARVTRHADVVYSTRYTSEEIALIRSAAKERGMATTAFIRAAALAAAAGDLNLTAAEKVRAVQDAQVKARELSEALQRL